MARRKASNGATLGFEQTLWQAADKNPKSEWYVLNPSSATKGQRTVMLHNENCFLGSQGGAQ